METALIKGNQKEDSVFYYCGVFFTFFSVCTSSISLSTQQYMISIVNMDCYKSPPVQTLLLFAQLLTHGFEEMTLYVAAQHQFYRCLKAVKSLLMTVMLWQVMDVTNNSLVSIYLSKSQK